jgi:hypothetical protein
LAARLNHTEGNPKKAELPRERCGKRIPRRHCCATFCITILLFAQGHPTRESNAPGSWPFRLGARRRGNSLQAAIASLEQARVDAPASSTPSSARVPVRLLDCVG